MTRTKIKIPQKKYEKIVEIIKAYYKKHEDGATNAEIIKLSKIDETSISLVNGFLIDIHVIDGEKHSSRKRKLSDPLGYELGKALFLHTQDGQKIKEAWGAIILKTPFHKGIIDEFLRTKTKTRGELINTIFDIAGLTNPQHNERIGAGAIIDILENANYLISKSNNEYQLTKDIKNRHAESERRKIFISCGQTNDKEKNLGKRIKELIDRDKDFEGYFAEYQQDLKGLESNIFDALNNSVCLITILHRRDQIKNSEYEYRASIWVEQEIAIATFIVHTLKRKMSVKAFIQNGVELRGVRQLIQLNPTTFETEEEVIDRLETDIPKLLDQLR